MVSTPTWQLPRFTRPENKSGQTRLLGGATTAGRTYPRAATERAGLSRRRQRRITSISLLLLARRLRNPNVKWDFCNAWSLATTPRPCRSVQCGAIRNAEQLSQYCSRETPV